MTTATPRTVTLTRLHANPRHKQVAGDLTDVERLHRRIMSMFPETLGEQPRAAAGVLFRAEYGQATTTILVQSTVEPDVSPLPAGYTAQTRDLGPLLEALTTGQLVRYRILANTVRIETHHGGQKRRIPLTGDDASTWWQRRADQAGLDLHTTMLTREDTLTGHRDITTKSRQQTRRRLRHAAAQFDGTALVRDPQAVREAIVTGLGRAKSYGCGLLSLVPLHGD